jgi:hypothetical protein
MHTLALIAAASAAGLLPITPPSAGEMGSGTPTMMTYVESSSQSVPRFRQLSGSWTGVAAASGCGSAVAWQVLRNNPKQDQLTLVTAGEDRAIRMQAWDGTSWTAPTMLTADCGNIADRVFDAAFEQTSGNMLAVYRKGSSSTVYFRDFTSANPAEQAAATLNGPARWISLAPRPASDQMLLLVATEATLYGLVWNGSSFGNQATLENSLPLVGEPYAATYTRAGKALVVWGSSGSASPRFAMWNGSAWSSSSSMSALAGTPAMIELAASPVPGSSEALIACTDSSRRLSTASFSGSAWSAWTAVETNLVSAYDSRAALAYEPEGGKAVVLWHSSGSNPLRYRTWSGTSWSGTLTGPDPGTESVLVRMVPGNGGQSLVAGVQRRPATNNVGDYTVYSEMGIVGLAATQVEGTTGQQVPGVTLPLPPVFTLGATDKVYANNVTATLAPGNYRDLSTGNGVTLNLSAGTYVFRRWINPGNNNIVQCNTSAGNIDIILATGDLAPANGFAILNSGGGFITVHILGGNFDTGNNASRVWATVVTYAGEVLFGMNTEMHGHIYARQNVSMGSSMGSRSSRPPRAASPPSSGAAGPSAPPAPSARRCPAIPAARTSRSAPPRWAPRPSTSRAGARSGPTSRPATPAAPRCPRSTVPAAR